MHQTGHMPDGTPGLAAPDGRSLWSLAMATWQDGSAGRRQVALRSTELLARRAGGCADVDDLASGQTP